MQFISFIKFGNNERRQKLKWIKLDGLVSYSNIMAFILWSICKKIKFYRTWYPVYQRVFSQMQEHKYRAKFMSHEDCNQVFCRVWNDTCLHF